jgi:putative addiction module CopG family antidote
MDIELPKHLQRFVREKMRSGEYETASEVVCEGLEYYAAAERDRERFSKHLQRSVAKGLASAKAGKLVDGEKFLDALDARLAQMPRRKKRA